MFNKKHDLEEYSSKYIRLPKNKKTYNIFVHYIFFA